MMKKQASALRKVVSVLLCLLFVLALLPAAVFGSVPVQKIVSTDASVSLKVGETYYFDERIAVFPIDNYASLTYKSSNAKVASVTSYGFVKGVKPGTATITVKSENGKKASVKVTVKKGDIAATKIKILIPTIKINKGQSSSFPIQVDPITADTTVTTATSNKKIAILEGYYPVKVKGVGIGTATIKFTMAAGKKSASFKVTVTNDKLPTKVEAVVQPAGYMSSKYSSTVLINKGETFSLKPQITPANAKVKNVVYYSDNTAVATVSSKGKVKGIKDGMARIYAMTVGGFLSAVGTVYVGPIAPRDVTITYPAIKDVDLNIGETLTAKAAIAPINATNKNIKWVSTYPDVATVDANGKVTAVASGFTSIRAYAVGGDEYTYGYFYVSVPYNYDN